MKLKLLLALCALLVWGGNASAQTDVTATYITNPSFETDAKGTETPTGWSISGTVNFKQVVDAESEIGDGYGAVTTLADGSKGYGIRKAWAIGDFTISQSVTLPAGFYVLKVDEKSVYAAEGSSNTPSLKLYAGDTQSENFAFTTQLANSTSFFPSPSYDFSTKSLSFYSDGTKIDIGVIISFMDKRNDVLLDNFKLFSYPTATPSDYDALNGAINAVGEKTLGFEVDEYAPYTNAEAVIALAAAKAINQSVPNIQSTVQEATAALTSAVWTANVSRLNAFYRGDFNDYTTGDISGDNRAVAKGWSNGDTYSCGVVGLAADEPAQGGSSNPGLAGLASKKALYLRGGFSTAYGSTTGYTVPLKANAIYTLSFTYGGWGQHKDNAGTVTVKDGNATNVLSQSVNTTGNGNSDTDAWQTFSEQVKTNDAGNYTVDLNFVTGGQSAFSDFSLLFQNYMVKASATELPVGNMTADTWYYFDIATGGDYKLTASNDLSEITYVTDGTLADNTAGTTFSVDANSVANLTVGRYYVKSSSAQSLTVAVYAIATPEDYDNLNDAISAAENNIGFEAGEYAPYNNKPMLTTLAEAKAIDQGVDNPQATVQGYTTALAAANWTANAGEENAIRWNIEDYPDDNSETNVPTRGFQGSNSGSRISHKSADGGNVGLRGLAQWMALMVITNTNATYGETEGYTLPLKANTKYRLKFKYAGWGENGTPSVSILAPDASTLKTKTYAAPTKTGNNNDDAWIPTYLFFETTTAGNYVVKFETSGGRDAFGDIELKKAVAEELTISENVVFIPEEDFADVTLIRTIKADTWNTFVVPFAISNAELVAKFGEDVAIAEYSETADGENSTVEFNTMATPAVAANTPVLLKTSTEGTSYEFTARTLEAGEAKVEGVNFDFVGSYLASIDLVDGDYFISSNNLYKKGEGSSVTLKGTRAYIKAKGASSVKIFNFVIGDEIVTGVDSVEAAEAEEDVIYYNLNGQQVTKDYKGIVIVNGKKFYNK